MRIVKIKCHLSIGYTNARRDEVIEVEIPDGLTDDEIDDIKENALIDWMWNYIDAGYSDDVG